MNEKKDGHNIKISIEAYQALKDYCGARGLFMSKFLDRLIMEKTTAKEQELFPPAKTQSNG